MRDKRNDALDDRIAATHGQDFVDFVNAVSAPYAPTTVTYQVTADGLVIAEFPNGYLATEFATKFHGTRAANGKVVTIKRSDGKPVA
jgi:hypothetical protein